ncbi:hypothetical protein G7D34_003694 [Salmonella enterica]|nr:hypothetical protein [Salmonella enterica]
MGGIFGKKGGSKQTTDKKEENTNWLMKNTNYTNQANQGILEGSQMNIPALEAAQYSSQFYNALGNMQQGLDLSGYEDYQSFYDVTGRSMLAKGQAQEDQSTAFLSNIQNMTGDQYRQMFSDEYNSDLVNEQIAGAAGDINRAYEKQVSGLNLNAAGSGNMGSSRAGVAQAVLGSEAQQNVARASLQYRTAEESAAESRLTSRLGMQTNAANTLANIGQNNVAQGIGLYSQGYGVYQGYNQAQLSNWNNAMYAGQTQQSIQQQQLDIQRQNLLAAQSPSLQRLGYMNQFLGPMAGYQTFGTSTTTTTTPAQKNGFMGTVMGAVGTGVGAYFGGPVGAQIGGSLGSAVGSQM